MKTPSPDLFHLIRSLSPQEKKYFKQYASQYGEGRDNNYLLLFNAMDAQAAYDEEAIKKQFAGHTFIKQLPVAKNYLFEKVLDGLLEMHYSHDDNLLVEKMMARFELLFKRNLIAPALAFYQKAEQQALEIDSITLLPHISRQKNLMLARSEKKITEAEWVNNTGAAIEHTRILLNFLEYEHLAGQTSMIYINPKFGYDEKLNQQLEAIMAHPLFESEDRALSFKAWHYFSKTKYRYLHVAGRKDECLAFIKNCIGYLHRNHANNATWQLAFFRTQSDYMSICVNNHKFEECREILASFEKMIADKYYQLPLIRQSYFYYKLLYHAVSGLQVDEALKFWIDNRAYWNEIKDKIEVPNRHSITYDVMRLYFKKRDWKNALITFAELIDHKTLNIFEAPARIYWLMLQYEIANLELLPNLTYNAREWFKKNKMMNPLEKVSLAFFDRLPRAHNKKEVAALFKKFKDDITALNTSTANQQSSIKYDLLEWIDSKAPQARN